MDGFGTLPVIRNSPFTISSFATWWLLKSSGWTVSARCRSFAIHHSQFPLPYLVVAEVVRMDGFGTLPLIHNSPFTISSIP
jgi:hypothetical protein